MKVPVSVVIPIKNEAENLQRCLESVSWADEIFAVDSQSIDGSVEIALKNGAKVVQFQFNGTWPKKKNWALEFLPFKNDWVFLLDADEILPPESEDEFKEICATNRQGCDGYFINRYFIFMGRYLKHAYYPNWNLRLFKHRLGRFEQLTDRPTNSGDNEVHEHLILQGQAGYLKVEMVHYAFPTVEVFIEKHNRYSNWEAVASLGNDCKVKPTKTLQSKGLILRRYIKNIVRSFPFRPFLRFLYVFLIQKGFLDGKEGYYFARLHGFYELFSICKTYELKQQTNTLKN